MITRTPTRTTCWGLALCPWVLVGLQAPLDAHAAAGDVGSSDVAAFDAASSASTNPGSSVQNAPAPASAPADATATSVTASETEADRLFREGLGLMHADRCQQAVELFAESDRLDPSAATLMNQAICYERIGKPASAWRTFVRTVDAAAAENDPELRSQAGRALSQLREVFPRLRLITSGLVHDLSVSVNGEPIGDYRDPIPVDPGENEVVVSAPGRQPWRITVRAKSVGTISIEVPALLPDVEHQAKPQRRTDLRPAALIIGGVGVVGLALGGIVAAQAVSANDAADERGRCDAVHCDQTAHDLRDTAWDRARLANWLTGLGAVAVTTGVVLWVTSPSNRENAQVGLTPWIDAQSSGGGVFVRGRL